MLPTGFQCGDRDFSPSPTVRVSVIIVCFYSAESLRECLAFYGDFADFSTSVQVIVVNNSFEDRAEVSDICKSFGAEFIQAERNLGYGRGCNLGACHALGDLLFFQNPDVLVSFDQIQKLAAVFSEDSEIVSVGPLQRAHNGAVKGKRRCVGQFPRKSNTTLRGDSHETPIVGTGFISGGALMVRQTAFKKTGGFDREIFLFHEDDELCLSLSKHGRMVYATHIIVDHDWGTSTSSKLQLVRSRSWHLGHSKVYVLRKHFGSASVLFAIIDALSALLSPAILSKRGRTKAIAFAHGVICGLRQQSAMDYK